MKNKVNTLLLCDAYKYTHWMQLPKGVTIMRAYIESRGTKLIKIDYTRFFGLQGFIKDYLEGKVIEEWMIVEAKEILGEVFGTSEYFNETGFRRLLEKHNGKLPLLIKSVREGKKVKLKNVLVTVENTDPEFPWLTQWVETMLLRAVWYPKAVCTISSAAKDLEKKYAEICGCALNPFFLNDFGARGVSSHESAEIGGAAHLVNYLGTDTVEAVRWAKYCYGKTATGYSVFASEHSTTTIYGRAHELLAYTNFLTTAPTDKIVSIVIDSYDDENAVKNLLGGRLRNIINNRTAPTVFRPDSGNPVDKSLQVLTWLWDIFGGTVNDNGFKVLNNKVRVIYGDGININSLEEILKNLVNHNFSIENIVFGMGGKLLQGVDRDTFMDACKVCSATVDGEEVEIYKDPIGDTGKKSKRGKLKLVTIDGEYHTVKIEEFPELTDELVKVFLNGDALNLITFEDIRKNANI
jgi:nicotinamide phosphoribosyltransferase